MNKQEKKTIKKLEKAFYMCFDAGLEFYGVNYALCYITEKGILTDFKPALTQIEEYLPETGKIDTYGSYKLSIENK